MTKQAMDDTRKEITDKIGTSNSKTTMSKYADELETYIKEVSRTKTALNE
jgi:hypothetical protein